MSHENNSCIRVGIRNCRSRDSDRPILSQRGNQTHRGYGMKLWKRRVIWNIVFLICGTLTIWVSHFLLPIHLWGKLSLGGLIGIIVTSVYLGYHVEIETWIWNKIKRSKK